MQKPSVSKRIYDEQKAAYNQDRKKYQEEEARLIVKFRLDLEQENGISDHPKASLLWQKAWENGHSGGLQEVIGIYEDLAELLEEPQTAFKR